MDNYTVTIDLQYEINHPDHAKYGDVIFPSLWPASSRASWKDVPFTATSVADLLTKIDAKFLNEIKAKSPAPNKNAWNISAPFSGGTRWRVGSGGLHEGAVRVEYDTGGPNQEWTFGYGPGVGTVYVMAQWQPA